MTDRDRVLRAIRALLQRTIVNGCPVEEALAAHATARALIDKYHVSHEELYGTGPGSRNREPEPAEPKQEQQPSPKKPTGRLVPFWMRMATVVTLVWLIGWYVVWGQGIWDDIQYAQQSQRKHTELVALTRQSCANANDPTSKTDHKDLDELFCHVYGSVLKPVEEPEPEVQRIIRENALFLLGSVVGIWGLFAMLQWLIRGVLR